MSFNPDCGMTADLLEAGKTIGAVLSMMIARFSLLMVGPALLD